jgi:hypothetical protein
LSSPSRDDDAALTNTDRDTAGAEFGGDVVEVVLAQCSEVGAAYGKY